MFNSVFLFSSFLFVFLLARCGIFVTEKPVLFLELIFVFVAAGLVLKFQLTKKGE